jgi:hypothetical protein
MLAQAVQKTMAKPGAKAPPAARRGADYRYPPHRIGGPLDLLRDAGQHGMTACGSASLLMTTDRIVTLIPAPAYFPASGTLAYHSLRTGDLPRE